MTAQKFTILTIVFGIKATVFTEGRITAQQAERKYTPYEVYKELLSKV